MISDKLLTHPTPDMGWSWQHKKNGISAILGRLNRETVAGIHELHELPDCVIYTYKQCVLSQSELEEPVFLDLLDCGILEFDKGIAALRRKR